MRQDNLTQDMSEHVPATTRCRPSRVRFLPTERMVARRTHLLDTRAEFARAADARIELRQWAAELLAVEAELFRRGELDAHETHLGARGLNPDVAYTPPS